MLTETRIACFASDVGLTDRCATSSFCVTGVRSVRITGVPLLSCAADKCGVVQVLSACVSTPSHRGTHL